MLFYNSQPDARVAESAGSMPQRRSRCAALVFACRSAVASRYAQLCTPPVFASPRVENVSTRLQAREHAALRVRNICLQQRWRRAAYAMMYAMLPGRNARANEAPANAPRPGREKRQSTQTNQAHTNRRDNRSTETLPRNVPCLSTFRKPPSETTQYYHPPWHEQRTVSHGSDAAEQTGLVYKGL